VVPSPARMRIKIMAVAKRWKRDIGGYCSVCLMNEKQSKPGVNPKSQGPDPNSWLLGFVFWDLLKNPLFKKIQYCV
jgi:hypothetical protein